MKESYAPSRLWAALVLIAAVFTSATESRASILPRNDLHFQDGFVGGNVTEEQFHYIIDNIIAMWQPLAEIHGAKLEVEKRWDDSTVNAYAMQSGDTWRVIMFGGLARRPEITPDGLALVVCHELGHHFGGYAFHEGSWAASEGQADYFATQVCARRIWYNSGAKNARIVRNAPRRLVNLCDRVWKSPEDRALCTRVTEAGLSLAKLLAAVGGERQQPSLDSKDNSQVSRTATYHPKAQCRLDTYLHGALCPVMADLKVIPGKNGRSGKNTSEAEADAARQSCMSYDNFEVGFRPRCWFKPLNSPFHDDDEQLRMELAGSGW